MGSISVVAEWRFERPGELESWQPNDQVVDVKVAGGVLSFRTVGDDPILELRSPLEISASPWQVIEIRMRATGDGMAEFFWSNTTEPPYDGFRPHKRTPFWVIGDGKWRTYRLMPFWHPEGKIIRFRFDPFGGADFEIDFIRIIELEVTESWRLGTGWAIMGEAKVERRKEGWSVNLQSPDAFLLAFTSVDADERPFVSVQMSATAGTYATLFFASENHSGLQSRSFPIVADGKERTYTLDMMAMPEWEGRIIAVGIRPTDAVGAEVFLRSVQITEAPKGAATLQIAAFALGDASPRVRAPTELVAFVRHTGGEPVRNLKATLSLPAGVEVLTAPSPVDVLEFGEEAELQWKVIARKPVKGLATLTVSAENVEPLTAKLALNFLPKRLVLKSDYVPEPKPVRGKYEIGVYYFPGWKTWAQWSPILPFPERKPVLGWYREGEPEVADWHIKWAVEHGITFFAYDWYWERGRRQLEHALHDGYMKARYRHLLKFCLLWANHNAPKTSSLDDCIAVTRFWIEHYFRLPEYFTVDDKPVVIIFSPHRLTEDMGSEGVRRAFEAMRRECVDHGLKGLYLVACVGDAGQAQRAAEEGYDAVSAYNWPALDVKAGEKWASFDSLIRAYKRNWERIADQSPIPLIVPISGGWDSRPWHGEKALVRFGRNPQNFRKHLRDAKEFLDKFVPQGKALPIAIIEAWNEWGEGSYIEPHAEFGFGYLDAIREVFTDAPKEHLDLAPVDVGLPLKEVEQMPLGEGAWEFERDEGWGWMQMADVRVENGCLVGRTTGNDPAFFSPLVRLKAREFPFVLIRMRLTKLTASQALAKDAGQLFWRTTIIPESEATSVRFEVKIDGQWHEYRLPVHENRRWRGMIARLRLDPCTQPNVLVEVDSIQAVRD